MMTTPSPNTPIVLHERDVCQGVLVIAPPGRGFVRTPTAPEIQRMQQAAEAD